MKIYYIKAQAPLRVLALAKHLGVKAEFVEADLMAGDLKAPEYAEINPNMKVPTLVAVVLAGVGDPDGKLSQHRALD